MIAITKKINPIHAFIVILLFQTILMVAKGYEKDFFHVDEALTFMLANSEYGLEVPEKYKNEWRPGSDYYDLLTVSADNTFNYKQVYINQTNDVHPPLYYFVIHTVSSFFPLQFSKWFGILPNIFFFSIDTSFYFPVIKQYTKFKIQSSSSMRTLRLFIRRSFNCRIHANVQHDSRHFDDSSIYKL